MREQLKSLIMSGLFKEAKNIFFSMKEDEVSDCLIELGYEKESIVIYGFMCNVLCEEEEAYLHYLASQLLIMPLCHIEGAYTTGFYHARRAVHLAADDIGFKEYLLLFYNIPDKLLNKQEAIIIARAILEKNPNSKVALDVLR